MNSSANNAITRQKSCKPIKSDKLPFNQRPRTEARFAVGSRHGQRSTIWKAWTQGDEAYLATRMFGKYQKVSFHSSGQCQWSRTDEWVKEHEDRRNSDRHFVRWEAPESQNGQATLVFKVDIPMSEIREMPPPTDNKKVFWVSGAPHEATVRFAIYMAPHSEHDPAPLNTDNRSHLFSLRFRSGRWMVVLVQLLSLSNSDLSSARRAVIDQFLPILENYELSDLRSVLFSQPNGNELNCYGFIEVCLDSKCNEGH